KTLGKKMGPKMKWAAGEIEKLDNAGIEQVLKGSYLLNAAEVEKGESPIYIHAEDIEISTDEIPGFEIAGKGPLTVALDIGINEALKKEGIAREFVNKMQNLRKDSGLDVMDQINVIVSENK